MRICVACAPGPASFARQPANRHGRNRLPRAGYDLSALGAFKRSRPATLQTKRAADWLPFFIESPASGRKRRPAPAGGCGIRILDHELRALEAFLVIDLRADEILVAHSVDQQHDPVFLHRRIVLVDVFVEREAVLESRAAAP